MTIDEAKNLKNRDVVIKGYNIYTVYVNSSRPHEIFFERLARTAVVVLPGPGHTKRNLGFLEDLEVVG